MEKINDFRILELTISGFKGFPEPRTFHFDYGVNFILGDNGLGKTTIAEAIAFAFMGTGFFGEKTLDRLQNRDAKEAFVSVRFADDTGEVHTLAKTRKNNANGITYDGYNVRQTDLYNLFGDKDLFLSMFNPLYFLETLGADGKNLLEKLLPTVSHEAVLAALPEDTRAALQEENILSPETYIKNRRAELKELEEDLIYMQGQADLLEDGAKKAQAELDAAAAELKKKKALIQENAQENSLPEMLSHAKLQLQKVQSKTFVFDGDTEICRLEAALEPLYARHKAIFKYLHEVCTGQKCALCGHEMEDADVLSARAELKRLLEQCIAEGKAAKAELKRLTQEKEKALQDFQAAQAAETTALEENIAVLEAQRQPDALRQECGELETKIHMLSETLKQPDIKGEMESIQQKIDAKKQLISHAVSYLGKKNELLFAPLQMNRVSISLSEVMKTTGEVKDTFQFTYDGKSYAKLSLSEKMRAGLEIAELIKRLSGRRYPTFLDNGESISVLDHFRPTGQMMIAKVQKGKPLTVLSKGDRKKENSGDVGKAA
ncbi:MAG: AAA family ATPase [Anaerotignum sp.]|nr:AAA family ATPase [Anaerotignum sp.]